MEEMSVKLGQAFQKMNEQQKAGQYGSLPEFISADSFDVPDEIAIFLKKRDEEIEKCRNLSIGVYG